MKTNGSPAVALPGGGIVIYPNAHSCAVTEDGDLEVVIRFVAGNWAAAGRIDAGAFVPSLTALGIGWEVAESGQHFCGATKWNGDWLLLPAR